MMLSVTQILISILLIISRVKSVSVEIEDVTAKQFRAALETESKIAVYWCRFYFYFSKPFNKPNLEA